MNKAHFPVTTLGPGRRVGLWLQGCSIGCAGCTSQDTWAPRDDQQIEVAALLGWIAQLGPVDGVTISGGEPFDQPAGLEDLLRGLQDWRADLPHPVDLLVYSGYSLSRLQRLHPEALALADAAITGPYVRARPTTLVWRGSANQELVPLSELGHERYAAHRARTAPRAALQAVVDEDSIWYIGVPHEGDMERLDDALRQRGVDQQEVSWRS